MMEIDKIKYRRPVRIRDYTQTVRRIEQMAGGTANILIEYLLTRGSMARAMKKRKNKK